MKILYCIPSLSESGGTERIVTQKINFLLQFERYDITIVTTEGINKKPFYDLHPSAKVIELNIDFLEEFSKPLYSKYIGTKRKLKEYKKKLIQIINTQNIDICISTGAKELEFLSQIQVPCKKICELHFSKYNRELFFEGKKGGIIWKLIGKIRTYQLIKQTTGLDQLVVLTKKDEKDWKKTHNNVKQIYNFSDIESESVALLENKKVISVGRLTEQKGYIFLIEAWAIIKNKKSDWTLEIYGEGDLYNELFHQIKDSNLENHVFLKGRTNQVQEKILESSIFALSSRYEGFPMVLLESMACGVPVVSFDCETGPAEIIENNDCGILVENRNVLKLAEAILTLMDDKDLRKKKGEIAKIKSANFSKSKIMTQWMDLFAELT
ncbi:glycosyltransferase family 4 protein [Kaistella haifensis]|nr:glycosyltransferase family 4 protein [Kaistella haifensis]